VKEGEGRTIVNIRYNNGVRQLRVQNLAKGRLCSTAWKEVADFRCLKIRHVEEGGRNPVP